ALHQLFEAQAARTPDRIALSAGSESLTYAELDRRATALAGSIQANLESLAERERIVAICAPRNANLLVGILAALKAGAAYLPLDPGYPRERLAFMLGDAAADLLLTEASVAGSLPDLDLPRLDLGAVPEGPAVIPPPANPGRLAYLIYTSGSTGRPKGVAIEHRSAVSLIEWARGVFAPEELEAVLASTSVCFDLSIFELFLPLAVGGRVVLVKDALALVDLPESVGAMGGVTLINTVPSALDALLRSRGLPATVRTVNLAGEPIPRELVNRVAALPNVSRMLNLYGPSEDTTYSTWASLLDDAATGRPVPIGRPVAGTRVHLLDAGFRPVPGGVPGHLHLGGEGLARGYFGRPELTAERFVPDPFSDLVGYRPGDRLYRTGDLARRRGDGILEFLGRIDHQVKVRGFRIELGEIEDALSRHPALREAAVAVREISPGDRRLVAFVAPAIAEGAALEPEARAGLIASLRAALQQTLPDAMIPSVWSVVPALPRNANGKLDRKALPEVSPEGERAAGVSAEAAWAPPRNEAERAIAEIWKDVLGIEKVGTRDNFFDLGGHSLLLVQVHQRLREGIAPSLPLVDLFRFPDVASLARHIAGDAEEKPARPAVSARLAPAASQDIAIVGLAGRFPRSPDLDTFWRNLRDGVECTTFFSREELLAAGVAPAQLDNPAFVPARGVFEGVD
ncbi:MAG TPA: amino acid adenylation domain-containing protein, partial [Thermoanaerobaculia bacterium]|nr:amino acid adenylation domain-containing protein [Thermoanaerobaculia bacterium]